MSRHVSRRGFSLAEAAAALVASAGLAVGVLASLRLTLLALDEHARSPVQAGLADATVARALEEARYADQASVNASLGIDYRATHDGLSETRALAWSGTKGDALQFGSRTDGLVKTSVSVEGAKFAGVTRTNPGTGLVTEEAKIVTVDLYVPLTNILLWGSRPVSVQFGILSDNDIVAVWTDATGLPAPWDVDSHELKYFMASGTQRNSTINITIQVEIVRNWRGWARVDLQDGRHVYETFTIANSVDSLTVNIDGT